ncbi:MAG: hypothetical protein R2713_22060 [Ilumatobacteraceae bacterium]
MTEIPEHLLKRSKAAKAKATGGEVPADAPATAAPAAVEKAAPAKAAAPATPAAPPPPKPDIPVVAAAKARRKVPFWAMATLSLLPLWTFMYVRGLTFKEPSVAGPLGEGAEIYPAACSGCHGGNGEGGVGYAFAGGEVLQTFPHIEDMLRFVYNGSQAYANAGITVYGNPERDPVHQTLAKGQMPAQGPTQGGGLTEVQILSVVCHERYTLRRRRPDRRVRRGVREVVQPRGGGLRRPRGRLAHVRQHRREPRRHVPDRHPARRGSRSRRRA